MDVKEETSKDLKIKPNSGKESAQSCDIAPVRSSSDTDLDQMEIKVTGQIVANEKAQNIDDGALAQSEQMHTERALKNEDKPADQTVSNKQKPSWLKRNRMLLFSIGSILFVTTIATCIGVAILKNNSNKVEQEAYDRQVNGIYQTVNNAHQKNDIDHTAIVTMQAVECPDGQFYIADTKSCGTCATSNLTGYSKRIQGCETCKDHTIYNPTTLLCEDCPSGQDFLEEGGADDRLSYCGVCPTTDRTGYNKKLSKCSNCLGGKGFEGLHYRADKKKCSFCDPGTFYLKSSFTCDTCWQKDKIYYEDELDCGDCRDGKNWIGIDRNCQTCDKPKYYQGQRQYIKEWKQCGFCYNQQSYNEETQQCVTCGPDEAFNRSSQKCEKGAEGQVYLFQDDSWGTCDNPAEPYNPVMQACSKCQNGLNYIEPIDLCTYCPDGFLYNKLTQECDSCPVGTYFDDQVKDCKYCTDDDLDSKPACKISKPPKAVYYAPIIDATGMPQNRNTYTNATGLTAMMMAIVLALMTTLF